MAAEKANTKALITIRRGHELVHVHDRLLAQTFLDGSVRAHKPPDPDDEMQRLIGTATVLREMVATRLLVPVRSLRDVIFHTKKLGGSQPLLRSLRALGAAADYVRHSSRSELDMLVSEVQSLLTLARMPAQLPSATPVGSPELEDTSLEDHMEDLEYVEDSSCGGGGCGSLAARDVGFGYSSGCSPLPAAPPAQEPAMGAAPVATVEVSTALSVEVKLSYDTDDTLAATDSLVFSDYIAASLPVFDADSGYLHGLSVQEECDREMAARFGAPVSPRCSASVVHSSEVVSPSVLQAPDEFAQCVWHGDFIDSKVECDALRRIEFDMERHRGPFVHRFSSARTKEVVQPSARQRGRRNALSRVRLSADVPSLPAYEPYEPPLAVLPEVVEVVPLELVGDSARHGAHRPLWADISSDSDCSGQVVDFGSVVVATSAADTDAAGAAGSCVHIHHLEIVALAGRFRRERSRQALSSASVRHFKHFIELHLGLTFAEMRLDPLQQLLIGLMS
jgi:hypothetical protein